MATDAASIALTVHGDLTGASTGGSVMGLDNHQTALVIAGGLVGGFLGTRASATLGARKQALAWVFSALVVSVGLYVAARGMMALA